MSPLIPADKNRMGTTFRKRSPSVTIRVLNGSCGCIIGGWSATHTFSTPSRITFVPNRSLDALTMETRCPRHRTCSLVWTCHGNRAGVRSPSNGLSPSRTWRSTRSMRAVSPRGIRFDRTSILQRFEEKAHDFSRGSSHV